jgi:hypothetical protein
MKRYWLFAGENYYPSGGIYDFRYCFDTTEEAIDYINNNTRSFDWAHVVDSQSLLFKDKPAEGPISVYEVYRDRTGQLKHYDSRGLYAKRST